MTVTSDLTNCTLVHCVYVPGCFPVAVTAFVYTVFSGDIKH